MLVKLVVLITIKNIKKKSTPNQTEEFNMSFTTSLLTSDPETREYNLLLTGTLCGFVKLQMTETTFKTEAWFFFSIRLV